MKKFRMTHRILTANPPQEFCESTPPLWLAPKRKSERWFWDRHVLTLAVGEHVNTDFRRIERIQ